MEAIQKELQELLSPFQDNHDEMRKIADELLVSFPTVQRWAEGKNLPHRTMCPPIIEYLNHRKPTGP